MKISSSLTDKEIGSLLQSFYEYFETGYAFEEFLREYLVAIGLDEVEVTKRSRDNGIDLKAIRKGVGDFSEIDITQYYVQAKRFEISNSISVREIRQLRGTLISGQKGIFITTSKFSKEAIADSVVDPLRPVILIDGKSLILSCVDNRIGFVYKPTFSENEMREFAHRNDAQQDTTNNITTEKIQNYIEKTITANDIRARIISIPSAIINKIDPSIKTIEVQVNALENYHFSINRGRNYFGGATDFLRKYGLLTDDGVACPKNARWYFDDIEIIICLYIERHE